MIDNEKLVRELMDKVADEMVKNLRGSIQEAVEREISKNFSKAMLEGEFFRRINSDLQAGLKDIYKEITEVKKTGANGLAVPPRGTADELFTEASDQLDKILQTTEQATVDIMDIVEKLQDNQAVMDEIVERIQSGGVRKQDRERLMELNQVMGLDLMNIMTALSFQDLTGQRIKRIIEAMKKVEGIVLDLYMSTGLKIKAHGQQPDKSLEELDAETRARMTELKGPQMGSSQTDVDDLLADLGL